jgi:hypothetical protein
MTTRNEDLPPESSAHFSTQSLARKLLYSALHSRKTLETPGKAPPSNP